MQALQNHSSMARALVLVVHAFGGHPRKFWYPWLQEQLTLTEPQVDVEVLKMSTPWEPRIWKWVDDLLRRVTAAAEDAKAREERCRLFLVGHSVGCQTIVRFLALSRAAALISDNCWLPLRGCLCVAAWLSAPSPAVIDPWQTIEPWCSTPIDCAAAHRLLLSCYKNEQGESQPLLRVLISDNDRYTPDYQANQEAWLSRLGGERSCLVDVKVIPGRAHFGSKKQLAVLAEAQSMLKQGASLELRACDPRAGQRPGSGPIAACELDVALGWYRVQITDKP